MGMLLLEVFYAIIMGKWILGFTRYLGWCSVFEVKLWGILDGFIVLLNKGFKRIIVLSDNLEVVRVLQDKALIVLGILVLRSIQQIILTEGQWWIRYVSG